MFEVLVPKALPFHPVAVLGAGVLKHRSQGASGNCKLLAAVRDQHLWPLVLSGNYLGCEFKGPQHRPMILQIPSWTQRADYARTEFCRALKNSQCYGPIFLM